MVKKKSEIKNKKITTKKGEAHENVEFTFHSRDAMNVYVAGQFNDWDTHSLLMRKDNDGIWKAKVELLPGRYEYKLFADNTWVEDLPNSESVFNPFGTKNFVILVK